MSAAVRAALAAAASSVEGIHCSPYFRQTTKPGDAMVRLDQINIPNPFGGITTWQVLVVLPQDIETAEKYMDDKVPLLFEALSNEAVVRKATPQELVIDTGRVPVVVIELTRESD